MIGCNKSIHFTYKNIKKLTLLLFMQTLKNDEKYIWATNSRFKQLPEVAFYL